PGGSLSASSAPTPSGPRGPRIQADPSLLQLELECADREGELRHVVEVVDLVVPLLILEGPRPDGAIHRPVIAWNGCLEFDMRCLSPRILEDDILGIRDVWIIRIIRESHLLVHGRR